MAALSSAASIAARRRRAAMDGGAAALVVLSLLLVSCSAQLSTSFYSSSCPKLPIIINSVVESAIAAEKRMGASLLRIHFHDCFVNGCDGSVLLDDTSSFVGEKTAAPNNNSLRGFDVVDRIKAAVEAQCPGVVSCADILAITARDSVLLLGGPYWEVNLGRRDSRTASKSAANSNIPRPNSDLANITSIFSAHGLSVYDMIALAGAHTIGQASCRFFRNHIYNDTNIEPEFAAELRSICPATANGGGSGDRVLAPLDLWTPTFFDNSYFKNLVARKALLHSDQEFFSGFAGGAGAAAGDMQVLEYAANPVAFAADFAAAMVKMGNISPLTGGNGEVRRNCRVVN